MKLAIYAESPTRLAESQSIAQRLGLACWQPGEPAPDLLLTLTSGRIELRQTGKAAPGPVAVDFVSGKAAHRRQFGGGRGTHLARAAGLKPGINPSILDATAGLGQDAFVLASLGCEVTLVERSPVIALLLQDGLDRARQDPHTAAIVERMHLIQADARHYLATLGDTQRPDVITLDPMYPHKDKSALAKKEMRLFQMLLGADDSGAEVLSIARKLAKSRVMVKRPLKAEFLGKQAPDADIRSPNTRYDLYFPAHKII